MLFLTISPVFGQEVEHNYQVGPQITTCDSLDIDHLTEMEAIKQIRSLKFRFQQSFKLTRRQGFKGGEYYSCDNNLGYLVLNLNESEKLYIEVKKEFWEILIKSSDPEGYYLKNKNTLKLF
jgi:hypothetical protein